MQVVTIGRSSAPASPVSPSRRFAPEKIADAPPPSPPPSPALPAEEDATVAAPSSSSSDGRASPDVPLTRDLARLILSDEQCERAPDASPDRPKRREVPAQPPAAIALPPAAVPYAKELPRLRPELRPGCRARLVGLSTMSQLNGEEVLVERWYKPSSRWIVRRVCKSVGEPEWPPPGDCMRVAADKLECSELGLWAHLRGEYKDKLVSRILNACESMRDLSRFGRVDKAFAHAVRPIITRRCVDHYAHCLPRDANSVELASPNSAEILPLLHRRLVEVAKAVRPLGGCVRAFLVEGPVLHVGQYTASPGQQPAGDLSCSYRVAQMQISHFMRTDTQAYWPGAREAFLDVPEVRHLERAVPAVRRLQRIVEQAWKDGFDPVGAESIENETFNSEGLLMVKKEEKARKAAAKEAKAAEKEAKAAGKIVSTASGGIALNGTSIGHSHSQNGQKSSPSRNGSSSHHSNGNGKGSPIHGVLDNGGVPVHQPHLKILGASDMWAMMRWSGTGAQLNDFIDGAEGEKCATDLLFDWVWNTLCRTQIYDGDGDERNESGSHPDTVRKCRTAPIYLQWAGHAVCVVGAVRRQFHETAKPERHLLIFNPESSTRELHAALLKTPNSMAPEPCPRWWQIVAWTANRASKGPRILLEEAIAKSAGNKDASDKGPGGESGPYQTMHVPHGWVTDPEERERVRAPEDACTQYVGDKQPAVLSMIQAPPSHMY